MFEKIHRFIVKIPLIIASLMLFAFILMKTDQLKIYWSLIIAFVAVLLLGGFYFCFKVAKIIISIFSSILIGTVITVCLTERFDVLAWIRSIIAIPETLTAEIIIFAVIAILFAIPISAISIKLTYDDNDD